MASRMQLKLKLPTERTYLLVTVMRMDDAQYEKMATGGLLSKLGPAAAEGTRGSSSFFLS